MNRNSKAKHIPKDKTSPNQELTVILPCAGEGNRLNLPSPKELFEIYPGTALIDFSINHIRSALKDIAINKLNVTVKTVVATQPWKEMVADHVKNALPKNKVLSVFFNSSYEEWPGSIYSAQEYYSEFNLVLLPDSYLSLSTDQPCRSNSGKNLLIQILDKLMSHNLVFGYVPCRDPQILKNLGAVFVNNDELITAFQDKPRENLDQFNGFWGCFGFGRLISHQLYQYLITSVRHLPQTIGNSPFYYPGSVRLHEYYDLGTWDSINMFKTIFNRPYSKIKF